MHPLTANIAGLERELEGAKKSEVGALLRERGISAEVLRAGMLARAKLGRINDVIHATAIALALPELLTADEVLKRPSLAAGNDPSRPFDVETNKRIAEFKLARWQGQDAMRKRQVFKDFVQLAADDSGRAAELYVLGDRPIHFLHTSKSTAAWGLDRDPATRVLFEKRFGSLTTAITDFTAGPGAAVRLVDLETERPDLFADAAD